MGRKWPAVRDFGNPDLDPRSSNFFCKKNHIANNSDKFQKKETKILKTIIFVEKALSNIAVPAEKILRGNTVLSKLY